MKTNNKIISIIKKLIIKLLAFFSINIFALIIVLPLSMHHFSILNISSIITNIFAVPLSFIILSSSLITIITYKIYIPLSIYPSLSAEFFTNILIYLAKRFSSINFLKYEISCSLYTAILITSILIFIGIIIRIKINNKKNNL